MQVDDFAFAGAADQDHRKAVDGGIGQCGQAVQKAWRGHGQANPRLLGHVAGDGSRIAGVLFMTEADEAHPFRLGQAGQIRDRNANQTKDGVNVVVFQGIDYKVKPVGQCA